MEMTRAWLSPLLILTLNEADPCKEMYRTCPQLWFLMLLMWILVISNDATRRINLLLFFFLPSYEPLVSESLCRSTWYLKDQSLPSQQFAYLMDCQETIASDCQLSGGPTTPISYHTYLPTSAWHSLCRRGQGQHGSDAHRCEAPDRRSTHSPIGNPMVLPVSWQRGLGVANIIS